MPVQIIPRNQQPSFAENLVGGLVEGTSKAIPEYFKNKRTQSLLSNLGLDPNIAYLDPELRNQIVASELQYGRKKKQAEASGNVNFLPKKDNNFSEEINRTEKKSLPDFQSPGKYAPLYENNNELEEPKIIKNNPKIPFSSYPQPETTGEKRQIYTPEQLFDEGHRIAEEYRKNGIPMTDNEGVQQAQIVNNENRLYNNDVDKDILARQNAQIGYGKLAVEKLTNVYPNATDEEKALFQKKGQEIAEEIGNDESKINSRLVQEAKNLKNNMKNVLDSPSAERLFNAPWRLIQGTSKTFDQRAKDLRIKLKPILDEGLYPLARDLVSQLGYYPEEIEQVVSNLSENAHKTVAQLPKMKKIHESLSGQGKYGRFDVKFSENQKEQIKDNIYKTFQSDPSVNLLLLRKAYEDKNVDWQTFKDIVDEGILDGQIKLTPEQYYFKDNIDNPPLKNLDVILEGLNIKGR
jgi:hypothetical protein